MARTKYYIRKLLKKVENGINAREQLIREHFPDTLVAEERRDWQAMEKTLAREKLEFFRSGGIRPEEASFLVRYDVVIRRLRARTNQPTNQQKEVE